MKIFTLSFLTALILPIILVSSLLGIKGCSGDEEAVVPPPPPPLSPTVWESKAPMPTARWGHSACIIDGKIYVFGGSEETGSNSRAIGTLEVYDPILNTWDESKTPMPTARLHFCACVIDGKIYTIAGRRFLSLEPTGIIEVYDPATDTWDNTKTPMPKPRSVLGYCVINNKIYFVGGWTGGANYIAQKDLQIYDPATDTWDTTKTPMSQNKVVAACGLNGTMYVIGGTSNWPYPGKKTVEIYNSATDTWMFKADLQEGRRGHCTNVLNGMIYAIGGGGSETSSVRSVEAYDPGADNWTIIEETPIWYYSFASCVFQGKIYCIGGTTSGSFGGNFTPTSAVYSLDPSLISGN